MRICKQISGVMVVSALMLFMPGCSRESGESVNPGVSASATTTKGALRITEWGPQETKAGVVFNVQPDGSASFWVHANQSLEGTDAVLVLNGTRLNSAITGSLITAIVPDGLYSKRGKYDLHIASGKDEYQTQSNDVVFTVK